MDLPLEYFIKLRNLIYERTGINYEENKIYYIKKRLQQRMQACEIDDVEQYIKHLKLFDRGGKEFQELINLLTVNETYFFREFSQLQVFAESCLDEVVNAKKSGGANTLKVLCAGCSTGEEAYTLAIILREMIDDYKRWNLLVKAIDIDENVLARARRGIYDKRSVKDVPESYLNRYFKKPVPGEYHVVPEIKEMVLFEHVNLMDRRALRAEDGYDFVFCRNVLIYFDDVSRKQVVDKFYGVLNRGGFIFLGHAESLSRMSTSFKIKRIQDHIVYQK
ncbi:CheR family methyltransferase [Syntrophomonas palmitatica]|uniref:CheR family methyltransferase n=1 Tax=Syntrophomonas palmitatica TaxID=402877 RepID=UPI0006D131C0|nr:protein-glutamate O-methyltransferase CheR [Syntrophomonas palmitatica]